VGVTRSEIVVPFRGEGSGVGELTWGQQEIWHTIQRTGRTLNIGGALPMPAGTSAEEIATMLRFWVGRHQSLRSRLRFVSVEDPPPDGPERSVVAGVRPQQVVAESGEMTLHVVDVDDDDDPASAAEALRVSFEVPPFDYPNEWPVRMGVVRRSGAVTHMVVQYCHLAVDGGGIEAMVQDLAHLDRATGEGSAPVPGMSPLELARVEGTPAGRRASDKSLRYWEGLLRGVPTQRFGESGDKREPRFWELSCYSPAMHLAMQSIAARTRTNTTHVLLAAYAVALARVTGRHPSVAQTVVSNRFRPGYAQVVGQISQPGLCVVDVADSTFDEVVGRSWKAVTSAALRGYYHPASHRELLDRLSAERGERIDISCFVNDRRVGAEPQPGDRLPTEEEVRAVLSQSTFQWDRKQPVFDATLFLQVDSGPDLNAPGRSSRTAEQGSPAVFLAIWADTHYMSPADVEAFARAMEAITVQAAFDPLVSTGVHPA
jgi:hypothetical protein